MQKQFTIGYLIGRFSGLHTGHKHLIREARKQCDQLVIFIGSANAPRTIKNPWTYKERAEKIRLFLNHESIDNVVCVPQNDYRYNHSQWINDITSYVEYRQRMMSETNVVSVLFGHQKTDTEYLSWFPQYKYVEIESDISTCATIIRERIFEERPDMVEPCVIEDWNYFKNENTKFANYPYPETLQFCTGDALIECAGHILMIKRGGLPGRGTWAIAGGHKNRDETFEQCIFRELTEETNLRVPEKVLRGSVVARRIFDEPTRGCGIPRITQVNHIKINLNPDGSLPEFRPADDAMECEWVLISEALNNPKYAGFDDHTAVIMQMTGVNPTPAYLNPYYSF